MLYLFKFRASSVSVIIIFFSEQYYSVSVILDGLLTLSLYGYSPSTVGRLENNIWRYRKWRYSNCGDDFIPAVNVVLIIYYKRVVIVLFLSLVRLPQRITFVSFHRRRGVIKYYILLCSYYIYIVVIILCYNVRVLIVRGDDVVQNNNKKKIYMYILYGKKPKLIYSARGLDGREETRCCRYVPI